MKRGPFPLIAFCLLGFVLPAKAENEPSLFFSPNETKEIEAQQKSDTLAEDSRCGTFLQLDSLLFFGTENWTAWLSGHRIEAQSRPQEWNGYRLLSASSAGLTFQKGAKPPFTLSPHEAYDETTSRTLSISQLPPSCRLRQKP